MVILNALSNIMARADRIEVKLSISTVAGGYNTSRYVFH